jgi:hypothetical protein
VTSHTDIPFLSTFRSQLIASRVPPRNGRRPRALRLVAGVVGGSLVLLAVMYFPRSSAPTTTQATSRSSGRFGITLPHPLIAGASVDAATAADELRGCACFHPPASGLGSMGTVVDAYVDDAGGVAFVLNDGTWVVLTPDGRSSEQYVRDMSPILTSADWPFSLVGLLGHQALGANNNPGGPAALMWVQGGYLWEVIGTGGASLGDLRTLANDLS